MPARRPAIAARPPLPSLLVAYDPGLRQGECEVVSAALLLYGMAAVEMVWEETAVRLRREGMVASVP